MYNAMRRCVPIASLLLGPVIYPQRTTPNIIGAIILITAGTITAAIGDLDFDFKVNFWYVFLLIKHFFKSYAFGAASVLSQSLYLLTLQKMGSENQLGKVKQSYNSKHLQLLTHCKLQTTFAKSHASNSNITFEFFFC